MNKTYNEMKENKKQILGIKKDEKNEKFEKNEKNFKSKKNTFTVSGRLKLIQELHLLLRIDMNS